MKIFYKNYLAVIMERGPAVDGLDRLFVFIQISYMNDEPPPELSESEKSFLNFQGRAYA